MCLCPLLLYDALSKFNASHTLCSEITALHFALAAIRRTIVQTNFVTFFTLFCFFFFLPFLFCPRVYLVHIYFDKREKKKKKRNKIMIS